MDLHIVPDAILDDVVEAHKLDVAIQDQFGCNCMTFWFDQDRGNVFCLIEAPDKESVINMHNQAHGLIPHKILEVNSNLVDAFLGRIQEPKSLDGMSSSDIKAFYSDPAFRVLLVTHTRDLKLLVHQYGRDKAHELFSLKNEIVRKQIHQYEGQEIEIQGSNFLASFVSASQAIRSAIAIQNKLHIAAELLQFKIGLHGGKPVSKRDGIFEDTISYAKHLCLFGKGRQVIISNMVNNLHNEDSNMLTSNKYFHIVSPKEETLLEKLIDSFTDNWNSPDFDVDTLSKQLFISQSQLYRKITSITGISPNNLLREYRLIKSLDILKRPNCNISQAASEAGFNSPSYFTKCFQKKYGLKPSEYQSLKVNPE